MLTRCKSYNKTHKLRLKCVITYNLDKKLDKNINQGAKILAYLHSPKLSAVIVRHPSRVTTTTGFFKWSVVPGSRDKCVALSHRAFVEFFTALHVTMSHCVTILTCQDIANKSATSCQQVVVMELGKDTTQQTQRTFARANLWRTCCILAAVMPQ